MQLILWKDNANREQNNQTCLELLCRDAACLMQRQRNPAAKSMGLTLIAATVVGAVFALINFNMTMMKLSGVSGGGAAIDDDEEDI